MPDRTGRLSTGECLDPEVLSAYIDGTLEVRERAEVEAHLASCADCYEVMSEVLRVRDELSAAPPVMDRAPASSSTPPAWAAQVSQDVSAPVPRPGSETVVRGVFGRRKAVLGVAGGLLATAAALLLVVRLQPMWWTGGVDPKLADLVEAVGEERTVEARLTGGFKYGPLRSPVRSGGRVGPTDNWSLLAAAGRIREEAEKNATPENLHALGLAYLVLGEHGEAVKALRQALDIGDTTADLLSDVSAAYLAGAISNDRPGDLTNALEAADRALAVDPNSATARFNRALVLERLNLLDAATDAWKSYLAVDASSGWADEANERLRRLAETGVPNSSSLPLPQSPSCLRDISLLQEQGRMGEMLPASIACEPEARTPESLAWAHFFRAGGYYYAGRPADAAEYAAKSLVQARQGAWMVLEGRALHLIGGLNFSSGQYEPALQAVRQALDVVSETDDWVGQVAVHQLTAEILRALGESEEAWRHYTLALQLGGAQLSGIRRHALLNSLALAGLTLGFPWFSADMLTIAESAASGLVRPALLAEARLNRARAWSQLSAQEAAVADIRSASEQLRVVSDSAITTRLAAELASAESEILQRVNPAAALAATDKALGYYGNLGVQFRQASLRLTKGRSALALGDATSAEREYRSGVQLLESEQAFLEQRRLRVSHLDRTWDLYRDLVALLIDQGRTTEALEILERGRSRMASASARAQRFGVPNLATIPPGHLVLLYFVGEDRIARWELTSTEVTFRSRSAADLDQYAKRLQIALSLRRPRSQVAEPLSRLGELLLFDVPIESTRAQRLIVIPDGIVATIPFSLLAWPGARLVLEHASLSMAPSFESYRRSVEAQSKRPTPSSVMVVAPPFRPDLELPPLPGARDESSAIAAMYPRSTLLNDERATADSLVKGLQTASVVHFAGHAIADPINPWNSRLIVSPTPERPRGVWHPALDADQRVSAVTVLAACSTAAGSQRRGEGPISIATILLASGAPAVIATQWDIPDEAIEGLFVRLHALMVQGVPPAEALRSAQLEFRQAEPSSFDWAAVILVGS